VEVNLMPKRKLVVVADNTYAAIELLSRLTQLPNPVLWSLVCGWMLHCTNPSHRVSQESVDGHA
jgi:hypothetical protein